MTNSKLGRGVEEVKNWALEQMPKGPPLYPKSMVTEHPERFFVAEIIREKIFLQYKQEIPYSIQVSKSLDPMTVQFLEDSCHREPNPKENNLFIAPHIRGMQGSLDSCMLAVH